jgi:hypothetical protein
VRARNCLCFRSSVLALGVHYIPANSVHNKLPTIVHTLRYCLVLTEKKKKFHVVVVTSFSAGLFWKITVNKNAPHDFHEWQAFREVTDFCESQTFREVTYFCQVTDWAK